MALWGGRGGQKKSGNTRKKAPLGPTTGGIESLSCLIRLPSIFRFGWLSGCFLPDLERAGGPPLENHCFILPKLLTKRVRV